jgi:hypothetical protein
MNKETKKNFTCAYRTECLFLKDDYKTVKNEIITFINSKADSSEEIKKGEIENLPHFNELPCSLNFALEFEFGINDAFKAYIWALVKSGYIEVDWWDYFDDIVDSEISYLTSPD